MAVDGKPAEAEEEQADEEDDVDELPIEYIQPEKTRGNRGSVSAEAYGAWNEKKAFSPPVIEKSDEQKERIKAVLMKSFMFQALEDKDLSTVIGAMKEVNCDA